MASTNEIGGTKELYDYLALVFSIPGAIIICALVGLFVIIYVLKRLEGNKFGFFKVSGPMDTSFEIDRHSRGNESSKPTIAEPAQSIAASEIVTLDGEAGGSPESPTNTKDSNPEDEFDPEFGMIVFGYRGDIEQIEKHYQRLKNSPGDRSANQIELAYLRARLNAGDTSSVEKLDTLTENPAHARYASNILANYFLELNARAKFNEYSIKVRNNSKTDDERASAVLLISRGLEKFESKIECIEYLKSALSNFSGGSARALILEALADKLYDVERLLDACQYLHEALQCDPLNKSARFSLAFRAAKIDGLRQLALVQYEILLEQEPKRQHVANNLGIIWSDLEIPILEKKMFLRAIDKGEALALRNYVNGLVKVGFVFEAKELISKYENNVEPAEELASARSLVARAEESVENTGKKQRDIGAVLEKFFSVLPDRPFSSVFGTQEQTWVDSNFQEYLFSSETENRITWKIHSVGTASIQFLNANSNVVAAIADVQAQTKPGLTAYSLLSGPPRISVMAKAVAAGKILLVIERERYSPEIEELTPKETALKLFHEVDRDPPSDPPR